MWEFWRRHRRKVFVTAGVLGSGYFLYKLYDTHRRRLSDLERELEAERENDEILKAQMQAHFENIQRIADAMTLPHAMHKLSSRVAEELDLLHLIEQLKKGKDQPDSLTQQQTLELWDRLKILSFTRMALSVWAMTTLSLYLRVQVNILGRHLYVDTARGLEDSDLLEEANSINRNDQQQFLASADFLPNNGVDFLPNNGVPALLSNMQTAATEILKGKQLKDVFNTSVLRGTIVQILDMFMSAGNHHHWLDYLMPEDARFSNYVTSSISDNTDLSDITKYDQLMVETRAVLSSAEFGNVVDISLKSVVDALLEDIKGQIGESKLSSGIPLARLLPRVALLSPRLLEEPSKNRFIQIIRNVPEVEVFFTLLYTNMPTL